MQNEIFDRIGYMADCSISQNSSQLCRYFLSKSFENIYNDTEKAIAQKSRSIQKAVVIQKFRILKKLGSLKKPL
jgi:hypothetical protein